MDKTLLIKAFTPFKRRTDENGAKHWPAKVLDTLETKYHLLPKDLLRLWYLRRSLSDGRVSMDYIYIYDRMMSQEQDIPVRAYHDLVRNHRLLLFKGTIFPDGSVHLEKFGSTLPHTTTANFPRIKLKRVNFFLNSQWALRRRNKDISHRKIMMPKKGKG